MEIRAAGPEDLERVRELWREYWEWLGLPGGFQDFENECAGLPGVYAQPRGRLLVAVDGERVVGTTALRPVREAPPLRARFDCGEPYSGDPTPGAVYLRRSL